MNQSQSSCSNLVMHNFNFVLVPVAAASRTIAHYLKTDQDPDAVPMNVVAPPLLKFTEKLAGRLGPSPASTPPRTDSPRLGEKIMPFSTVSFLKISSGDRGGWCIVGLLSGKESGSFCELPNFFFQTVGLQAQMCSHVWEATETLLRGLKVL